MSDTPPKIDDDTTKLDAFEQANELIRQLDGIRASKLLSPETKAKIEGEMNAEIARLRGISGPQHVTGRMG